MLVDERSEFCDATALSTSGTGRALVGDVIDLTSTSDDLGHGEPVYLVIQVTTAVTSAGAATVSFILCSDAAAAIQTDGSASDHVTTAAIPKATLVAGYEEVIPLPSGDYERYLGVQQNVATAALTAGAINAFLTSNPRRIKQYADAAN